MLLKDFPGRFGFSVSHTTRAPRPGEVNGTHYHFSEKAVMQEEIDANKFIEHANVHGNLYGTRSVDDDCGVGWSGKGWACTRGAFNAALSLDTVPMRMTVTCWSRSIPKAPHRMC